MTHKTVLLDEAAVALNIRPDGFYIDGTYGRGGHSQRILQALNEHGRLLAIDQDPQAISHAQDVFADEPRFSIWHGGFQSIAQAIAESWGKVQVDGVLLDLGVSSPQLDQAERGFSFRQDGPLDMRMNPEQGQSAQEWLAIASQKEIADVLWEYGEERYSKRIARTLVQLRSDGIVMQTTAQLANVISRCVPKQKYKPGMKHPATRSFQAIRIYINAELEALQQTLQQVVEILRIKGRLVVISFHSLEDRKVKRFLREHSRGPVLPKGLPIQAHEARGPLRVIGKVIKPCREEIENNPRARSAVMRIGERV